MAEFNDRIDHYTIVYTFSIKVMSRGSVVSTGQITRTSFDILITDKMAPNARLIVYYVRADGEIVTDSISFDVDGAFFNQVMPCMENCF